MAVTLEEIVTDVINDYSKKHNKTFDESAHNELMQIANRLYKRYTNFKDLNKFNAGTIYAVCNDYLKHHYCTTYNWEKPDDRIKSYTNIVINNLNENQGVWQHIRSRGIPHNRYIPEELIQIYRIGNKIVDYVVTHINKENKDIAMLENELAKIKELTHEVLSKDCKYCTNRELREFCTQEYDDCCKDIDYLAGRSTEKTLRLDIYMDYYKL